MIGRRLVNGVESSAISVDDRGLQYGDGLFETMAAINGRVRNFARHMERLARRLPPARHAGARRRRCSPAECERALTGLGAGSVKMMVTRGPGPRSYRPPAEPVGDAHRGVVGAQAAQRPRGRHRRAAVRDAARPQSASRGAQAPQPPRAGDGLRRMERPGDRRGPDVLGGRTPRLRDGRQCLPGA